MTDSADLPRPRHTAMGLPGAVTIVLWFLGAAGSLLIWYAPGAVFLLTTIWLVGGLVHRHAPSDDQRFVTKLFWWGIGTRLVFSILTHIVAIYFEHGYPYLWYGQQSHDLFGDSSAISLRAFWMASYWKGAVTADAISLSNLFGDRASLWVYLYAGFYYLFGFSSLALKWINCLLGTLCGVVGYGIGRTLFQDRAIARVAAVLVMFFPSTLLWSLSNLKETPTMLALCLILWAAFRLERRRRWQEGVLLLIWMVFLWCVRMVMVIPTIVSLCLAGWCLWRGTWWKKFALTVGLLAMALMGFGILRPAQTAVAQQKLIVLGDSLINTQCGVALKEEANSGYQIYPERVYLRRSNDQSPYDLSLSEWGQSLVKGVAYFLFAPFPWRISSRLQAVAYPEMILWYLLIPLWIKGVVTGLRFRPSASVLILAFIVVLTVVSGLSSGNIGTSFRHRAVVIPFFLLLSAVGWCRPTLRMHHAG